MRFLWYINLLLLSVHLSFIAGAQEKNVLPLILEEGSMFHTTIDVYGKTVSGLSVFQAESDQMLRVLFTTFAGPKLLDLRITTEGYEKIYAMKQLDYKVILATLYKDFAIVSGLFAYMTDVRTYSDGVRSRREIPLSPKEQLVYYSWNDRAIDAELFAGKERMLSVDYFYSECGKLEKIFLRHYTFKMRITLMVLEEDVEEN